MIRLVVSRAARFVASWLFLAHACSLLAQTSGQHGVLTGVVSNEARGDLLEGARVQVPALGLTVLTDNTGRFVISDLPVGTHRVVVSYIGLDNATSDVAISAGQRAVHNFDLSTGIYKLQEFKVTGEREGNAAAITAQRNAANLKNVVAMDAYGNLPNMNAGELAILLPGVAGNLSDEGVVTGLTIRGMSPGDNTVTVDGSLVGSQGAMNRAPRIHALTGAVFEQLELTKGHTPDKGADSLGGTVNLRTRSPLSMKEKRRVAYGVSARLSPGFVDQIPMREQHRLHPLINGTYQEVFDAFGGERNLGVAVNLFYSELAVGLFRTTRDFQNTTSSPAYLWDYRLQDNYNNRKQMAANVKVDYRLSPNTKLTFNTIYNDAMERFRLRYEIRAYTQNQNAVPNATNSGVMPGFTDRVTQVRPVAASAIDVTSQMFNYNNRLRHFDVGAEHEFGSLQIDYNAVFSRNHINNGGGEGGTLVNRITNVGWILDRTESDLYPRFTQTAGPDIFNPANYRPSSLNFPDQHNDHEVRELRANVRYKLPFAVPTFVKTGVRWREESAQDLNLSRRYNPKAGAAALPSDPSIALAGLERTGLSIPLWNANAISVGRRPVDMTPWTEDIYFHEMTKYTGTRGVTEITKAGYVMAQGNYARLGYLGGVRVERTEDESWGWVRNRFGSTPAEQAADPIGAARRDYADTRRDLEGSYTKSFPSVHLTYDVTPAVKARTSWSTGFTRPPLVNLVPNETVSEVNQTLTINNPSLRPQTAETWDISLDYYFEPVGNLSVGYFYKTIDDYFIDGMDAGIVGTGPNNGYNGEYAGFALLTRANAGTATVSGWEFSYRQQLTFLPGPLRGLGVMANYTVLETEGDFGGATTVGTGEVPGFIPRTGNAGLTWTYRGFGARIGVNYTGNYITAYNATSPARNNYLRSRTITNVGIAYQFRPALSFTIDVTNLFDEPQVFYRGYRDRMQSTLITGTTITFGVAGRF